MPVYMAIIAMTMPHKMSRPLSALSVAKPAFKLAIGWRASSESSWKSGIFANVSAKHATAQPAAFKNRTIWKPTTVYRKMPRTGPTTSAIDHRL